MEPSGSSQSKTQREMLWDGSCRMRTLSIVSRIFEAFVPTKSKQFPSQKPFGPNPSQKLTPAPGLKCDIPRLKSKKTEGEYTEIWWIEYIYCSSNCIYHPHMMFLLFDSFSEHQIWVPGLECKNHTTSNLQGFQGNDKVGYTRKLRQFAKAPANFALLGRPAGHSNAINSNCHLIFGLSACCHTHVASSFAGRGLNFHFDFGYSN